MRPPASKPCRECPFKRKCLPGYTGAQPAIEFLAVAVHGESALPCHLTVDYDREGWDEEMDLPTSKVRQCSGYATFLANTGKSPRNPAVYVGEPNREIVFGNGPEMLAHHLPKLSRREAMEQLRQTVMRIVYGVRASL